MAIVSAIRPSCERMSRLAPLRTLRLSVVLALLVWYVRPVHGQTAQLPTGDQMLRFSEESVDAGVLPFGSSTYRLRLSNPSSSAWTIWEVRSGMSYMMWPKVSGTAIGPGQTVYIPMLLNTKFKAGETSNTVYVTFRSGSDKTSGYTTSQRIKVSWFSRRDIVCDPEFFSFEGRGNTDEAELVESTLTLRYAGSPAWRIESTDGTDRRVAVAYKELGRTRTSAGHWLTEYRITVRKSPSVKLDEGFSDVLLVTSDQGRLSHLRIPIQPAEFRKDTEAQLKKPGGGVDLYRARIVRADSLECSDRPNP